jgi:hypothetical protein
MMIGAEVRWISDTLFEAGVGPAEIPSDPIFRPPGDQATQPGRFQNNDCLICQAPRGRGPRFRQVAAQRGDGRLAALYVDGPADEVDAAPYEVWPVQRSPELRAAEIAGDHAPRRELGGAAAAVEGPDVKVFDPVPAVDVVQCGTLAECDA